MSVTTRLEIITPAKAHKWLEGKASNRPVSEPYAKIIASAITAGEWEVNGETVKFNVADEMIDGQHRCLAIVIAQKPIKSFVTRGLNDCTFDTIDIGQKRTMGQIFAKNGVLNYNRMAAAVAWLWRYEMGYIGSGRSKSPRIREGFNVLEQHPGLSESAQIVVPAAQLMTPSLAACLHYLFAEVDRDRADRFFEQLASGENLSKSNGTSGILALRNALTNNKAASTKLQSHHIWALAVKAWNAYRDGRVIKSLRFIPGTEEFPSIK
jgi:hypothetical protein